MTVRFLDRIVKDWQMTCGKRICGAIIALLMAAIASSASADGVNYEQHIKPVLRNRCYACHGALKQEADLRLDTVEFMLQGGQSGSVIVAGDPKESLIVERITAADPSMRMPPEG